MRPSKKRDIQVLSYILKNQEKIDVAIQRMGVSLNSSVQNSILKDEQAFDLCAMYMAQIGENVKLLTDDSKNELSKVINLDILRYFRISHINVSIL